MLIFFRISVETVGLMVLIIRNNRIQSRRHYRIKQLWYNDLDVCKGEILQKTESNMSDQRKENARQVKVLGTLFIYSVAMFTLPFAAFFGTQHILRTEFNTDRFTNNCLSAAAAIITVYLIIWSYAYKAFFEPDAAPNPDQYDKPTSKDDLNLKED